MAGVLSFDAFCILRFLYFPSFFFFFSAFVPGSLWDPSPPTPKGLNGGERFSQVWGEVYGGA